MLEALGEFGSRGELFGLSLDYRGFLILSFRGVCPLAAPWPLLYYILYCAVRSGR